MSKYDILLGALDQLRKEAPSQSKRYYPANNHLEGLNNARARAFIHLFLKVKFGLLEFAERESYITDDTEDGGIDAYYIDDDTKRIYFIQSKFRTTETNFQSKEIALSELLQMDADRISNGDETNERGIPYNYKIKKLIQKIREIQDIGRWKYEIIILANLGGSVTSTHLRKLTGGFGAEIFDHKRAYKELLFPVVQGTYYSPGELKISINLSNTSSSSARITYKVTTKNKECDITVLFVPTLEIAKTLYKYRNSILKYNPRSYLELSNNNVNRSIAKTITDLQTNEFALYNNGITMLSFDTAFNEKIGQKDKAQLIITQPQIINGGQTAFTLSRLYEEHLSQGSSLDIFTNKEVLLKVITLHPSSTANQIDYLELIEDISKATNQQSPVDDADRRSNDQIQIILQNVIFERFGYFYERKRGEFADGIRSSYITRNQIIDRELFLRLCKSCDLQPAESWRAIKELFDPNNFNRTLNNESRFPEYFFAFKCYELLAHIKKQFVKDKNNKSGIANYGNALVYGQYAVVAVCRLKYQGEQSLDQVDTIVNETLSQWLEFETYVTNLPTNSGYFRTYVDEATQVVRQEVNFGNYYKGRTLNEDLQRYFHQRLKTASL
jgi:hypothetical protein